MLSNIIISLLCESYLTDKLYYNLLSPLMKRTKKSLHELKIHTGKKGTLFLIQKSFWGRQISDL